VTRPALSWPWRNSLAISYEQNDTSEFPAAFAAVEKILNEGNQEADDLAGIGVIEDLQTIASHSCPSADFPLTKSVSVTRIRVYIPAPLINGCFIARASTLTGFSSTIGWAT
jgi:hypothetical protein